MKSVFISIIWGGATIINIYKENKWLAIVSFTGYMLHVFATTTKRAG